MMNYHEMTATGAMQRQNKNQYLFLMLLGGGFLFHAIMTAGTFMSVTITEGEFPGGEFVYKYRVKDYAASLGTCRRTADDLNIDYSSENASYQFYTMFLDDPAETPSGKERWLAGYLDTGSDKSNDAVSKQRRLTLLEKNKVIGEGTCELGDKECMEKYSMIPFEHGSLPKNVKAAYVEFPFHNGLVSALVQNYKIIPALQSYIRQNSKDVHSQQMPIVLTTCSVSKSKCRHYGILEKSSKFLLGNRHTTKEYVKILNELKKQEVKSEGMLGGMLDNIDDNIRDVYRGIKKALHLS